MATDVLFFAMCPPETGHSSHTTWLASLISVSSFSESCFVRSAVCRLVALRVASAVERWNARTERSGLATLPVVIARGGWLWRFSYIILGVWKKGKARIGGKDWFDSWHIGSRFVALLLTLVESSQLVVMFIIVEKLLGPEVNIEALRLWFTVYRQKTPRYA